MYFAHSYVHYSFISCDIITSNDNALIQQLGQGTKGVTHGNKLIRKLRFWISPRGFCFSLFACFLYIYFLTSSFFSLFLANFLFIYFKLRLSRIFLFIVLYFIVHMSIDILISYINWIQCILFWYYLLYILYNLFLFYILYLFILFILLYIIIYIYIYLYYYIYFHSTSRIAAFTVWSYFRILIKLIIKLIYL